MTHDRMPFKPSPPYDLFGTKPLANQCRNRAKLQRPISPVAAGSSGSATGFLHRMKGTIASIMHRLIPLHLPIQRATMPPKMLCYLGHPDVLPPHRGDLITFLRA